MVQVLYDFPLPNNGERYDLSQKELHEILEHVYNCGFENARNRWDPARQGVLTWGTTKTIKENEYVEVTHGKGKSDLG